MVEYIEKVQINNNSPQIIESGCFRGHWNYEYFMVCSKQRFTKKQTISYDLSEYLPNDGYDYEIAISFVGTTGGATNNSNYFWAQSGESNWIRCRLCGVTTRTNSYETCAGFIIFPIKANDKVLKIYSEDNTTTSGDCWCWLGGYRRLGKPDDKSVEVLKFGNRELAVGNLVLPGKWNPNPQNIFLDMNFPANMTSDTTINVDVSDYIPNDGHDYEVMFDGTGTTAGTTNQYIALKFMFGHTGMALMECIDRSGNKVNYFNMRTIIKANDKTLKLYNTGNAPALVNLRYTACRRLGYSG